MSSRDDIILQLLMLDVGIIPYPSSDYTLNKEDLNLIDKRIANLEPGERRVIKRKFRKLWRKAVKSLDNEPGSTSNFLTFSKACGLNNPKPSPSQKQSRRLAVVWYLRKKAGLDIC